MLISLVTATHLTRSSSEAAALIEDPVFHLSELSSDPQSITQEVSDFFLGSQVMSYFSLMYRLYDSIWVYHL